MSSALRALGRGEAAIDASAASVARRAASALAAIRYADPAAWAVAVATARASEPLAHVIASASERTGIVATSAIGPAHAMDAIRAAARDGTSSPIRFPAASPGSLAGLAAIAFGLRGPTLALTLPPERGVPVALLLAEAWTRRGVTSFVVLAAAGADGARALLVGAEGTPIDAERDLAWLLEVR